MGFAVQVNRVEPPNIAPEKVALGAWLDYYRATVLKKIGGLDDEGLRRVMVPTGLCLLGLVKHLADVEHAWFVVRFSDSDESYLFRRDDDPEAAFRIEAGDTTEAVVEGYLQACERSRAILAAAGSLDDTFEHAEMGRLDLRWLLIHMIEETARHAGHMDIMRELIDGVTGD